MNKEFLTESETGIMMAIWDAEKEKVPFLEIMERLTQDYGKSYKRTSIETFLYKLEAKGFVSRSQEGRYSYIKPEMKRETYKTMLAEHEIDFWHKGSVTDFICSLCAGKKLTKEEADSIRKLIDELEK